MYLTEGPKICQKDAGFRVENGLDGGQPTGWANMVWPSYIGFNTELGDFIRNNGYMFAVSLDSGWCSQSVAEERSSGCINMQRKKWDIAGCNGEPYFAQLVITNMAIGFMNV